jgi:hypothetical protein
VGASSEAAAALALFSLSHAQLPHSAADPKAARTLSALAAIEYALGLVAFSPAHARGCSLRELTPKKKIDHLFFLFGFLFFFSDFFLGS